MWLRRKRTNARCQSSACPQETRRAWETEGRTPQQDGNVGRGRRRLQPSSGNIRVLKLGGKRGGNVRCGSARVLRSSGSGLSWREGIGLQRPAATSAPAGRPRPGLASHQTLPADGGGKDGNSNVHMHHHPAAGLVAVWHLRDQSLFLISSNVFCHIFQQAGTDCSSPRTNLVI